MFTVNNAQMSKESSSQTWSSSWRGCLPPWYVPRVGVAGFGGDVYVTDIKIEAVAS